MSVCPCPCLCSVHTREDIVNFICAILFTTQMKTQWMSILDEETPWWMRCFSLLFFICVHPSEIRIEWNFVLFIIHRWWLQIEETEKEIQYDLCAMHTVHERLTEWSEWMKLSEWMNSLTSHMTLRLRLCSSEKILRKICQVKSQCLPRKKEMLPVIYFAKVCMAINSCKSKYRSQYLFPKRVFSCYFIPMKKTLDMK